MRNIIYICLFVFSFQVLQAQHKQIERIHEIGVGVGGLNYTGDLAENLRAINTKFAGNILYRYNFRNEVSVLRANIILGQIGVDEAISPEPLRAQRGLSFSGFLTEFAGIYEYDFFNYRDIKNKYYMSPYLFGGIAFTNVIGTPTTSFVGIPFGAGLKFKVYKGWNVGMEFGARKNFTDKIDGVEDEALLGSSIQSDWHYYSGITLSYTFYKLICSVDVPGRAK